jgi:hypothetical protein
MCALTRLTSGRPVHHRRWHCRPGAGPPARRGVRAQGQGPVRRGTLSAAQTAARRGARAARAVALLNGIRACDDRCMSRARTVSGKLRVVVAALTVVLAGCSSAGVLLHRSSGAASPGVPAALVGVIRGWSDALRAGHVAVAAGYFRIPSVFFAGNGAPILLRSVAQVEIANAALPCGAIYLSAHTQGRYVNALFRLTNRSGPGGEQGCGSGTGQTARVDLVIRDGRIVQWLRAPDEPGDNGSPRTAPSPSLPGPAPPPSGGANPVV